ncbi:M48 family metallopeptidase [Rheinheimera sp. WS51]|uniref:M48 family metallopeptidase n=1 Tax=Rheinheimera sp. WS51 TaxID=3425886 RepID=UPI003D8F8422
MSDYQPILGQYQAAGSSRLYAAVAMQTAAGQILIQCAETGDTLAESTPENYRYGMVLPGLAVELRLGDGALFTPNDPQFRWPALSGRASVIEKLERHKLAIVSAIILSPLLLWWIIVDLMPIVASAAVPLVPSNVKQQMGQQTLYALKQTALQPTELDAAQKANINYHWQMAIQQLELRHNRYQLHLYKSDFFGPNALALPDGTVLITDQLALLLKDNPDAILAVLLHEIGHVEAEHSVRMAAQSLGSTLVLSILFGNPDGLADLLLGSGSALLQNAFSRDMEREADQFALNQLTKLGKSPLAFADAMSALLKAQGELDDNSTKLLKYLSTHPGSKERIEQAKQHKAVIN